MKSQKIRLAVQLAFLIFLSWIGYRHQLLGGGPEGMPPVDALCPVGGIEGLYAYLKTGTWLRRLAPSSLVLFAGVVAMTVVVGRIFCSWICPLGTIGELSAKAARKLAITPRELPESVDRPARYLKYAVLALILFFTWKLGTLAWRNYDPWVAWMHLSAGWKEVVEKPWAYIVLFGAVIAASLWIERFWCRYLCPLGALLALGQKLSLVKIRRNDSSCIHCHLCHTSCPVNLNPEAKETENSAECIACGRCADTCPVEKTLSFGKKKKFFSSLAVGIVGLLLFFGFYGAARLSGEWTTYAPSTTEGVRNAAGGIYGWMTLHQVAETVKLTEEEVIAITNLPAGIPRDVSLKNIEGVNDEELRALLEAYLEKQKIEIPSSPQTTPQNPEEIKGSMTLSSIAETYGLAAEKILAEAGWPMDAPKDKPLKELAAEYKTEVSVIREAVKKLLKQ